MDVAGTTFLNDTVRLTEKSLNFAATFGLAQTVYAKINEAPGFLVNKRNY